MTREEAIAIIRASELASDADRLIAELKRSIHIRARRANRTVDIGESRLGGFPDLPKGFDWPRYSYMPREWDSKQQRQIDRPPRREVFLQLIAQLRLSDFQSIDTGGLLPKSGWLCFFYGADQQPWGYDPEDRLASRVVYFDTPATALERAQRSPDASECKSNLCELSYSLQWTLPDYGDNSALPFSDTNTYEEIKEVEADLNPKRDNTGPIHQLLGNASHIQGDMRLECQLVSHGLYCGDASGYENKRAKSLQAGVKDWRLLLQIDTDEDGPGWMWGDCGRIYFWIREQDLRRRAFDTAWLILQCY